MDVKLIHHTPLWVASTAIRKCWASEDKSDTNYFFVHGITNQPTIGTKDKELIHRVGNKNKHSSTLEHLNYSFDIDGISRACLQEVARHRHASISVKSTRYTLKELKETKGNLDTFIVAAPSAEVNKNNLVQIGVLQGLLKTGLSNDIAKYSLPEAYKTSYVWTINARSLQNFLSLRTDKSALWEIRDLAHELFNKLPEEHKYLFTEFVKERQDV